MVASRLDPVNSRDAHAAECFARWLLNPSTARSPKSMASGPMGCPTKDESAAMPRSRCGVMRPRRATVARRQVRASYPEGNPGNYLKQCGNSLKQWSLKHREAAQSVSHVKDNR